MTADRVKDSAGDGSDGVVIEEVGQPEHDESDNQHPDNGQGYLGPHSRPRNNPLAHEGIVLPVVPRREDAQQHPHLPLKGFPLSACIASGDRAHAVAAFGLKPALPARRT